MKCSGLSIGMYCMKSPVGVTKSKPAGQVLEVKSKKTQCALNRPWTQHTSYRTLFLSDDLTKHPSTNSPTDHTIDPTAYPTPIRPKTRCQIPATTTEAKLEFNIKSLLSDAAVQAAVGTRDALPALRHQARR